MDTSHSSVHSHEHSHSSSHSASGDVPINNHHDTPHSSRTPKVYTKWNIERYVAYNDFDQWHKVFENKRRDYGLTEVESRLTFLHFMDTRIQKFLLELDDKSADIMSFEKRVEKVRGAFHKGDPDEISRYRRKVYTAKQSQSEGCEE